MKRVRYILMTALVAYSSEKLQKLLSDFERGYERRNLRVNENKSKVIRYRRERERLVGVCLNGENRKEMKCFSYLVVDMVVNGPMELEVSHSMDEGKKILGVLRNVRKERSLLGREKVNIFVGTVVLTVLYEPKAWAISENVKVLKIKCLRFNKGKHDRL